MKPYESIFILNPNIDTGEAEKVVGRMQEVITSNGGAVTHVEKWGKRKLAYEVAKFKKGDYVLIQYTGVPGTVTELERNFKMTDPVIKFMTVKMDNDMVAAAAAARTLEAAQAAQAAQAEQAAQAAESAPAAEAAPAETQAESASETDKAEA
jgi:small subunit ribosomal protein S6